MTNNDLFPDPDLLEPEEISSRFNDLAYRQRTAKDLTDEELHYAVALNHALRSKASATPKRGKRSTPSIDVKGLSEQFE